MQSATGIFKVRGIVGPTDRLSWCKVTAPSGIKLHVFPRPVTTVSEHTQTIFKAKQRSGNATVCDTILDTPVLTPIRVTLASQNGALTYQSLSVRYALAAIPKGPVRGNRNSSWWKGQPRNRLSVKPDSSGRLSGQLISDIASRRWIVSLAGGKYGLDSPNTLYQPRNRKFRSVFVI